MQRHRHQEFIRILNLTEARVPDSKAIHVILDNHAADPKVREWLLRHPRFATRANSPKAAMPPRGCSASCDQLPEWSQVWSPRSHLIMAESGSDPFVQ